MMLTFDDCVALCDLSEEEVAAIAEHEHIPAIVAAELGNYLVHSPEGIPMLKRFILDDIEAAASRGDSKHALALRLVLRHFVETHPENAQSDVGSHAQSRLHKTRVQSENQGR